MTSKLSFISLDCLFFGMVVFSTSCMCTVVLSYNPQTWVQIGPKAMKIPDFVFPSHTVNTRKFPAYSLFCRPRRLTPAYRPHRLTFEVFHIYGTCISCTQSSGSYAGKTVSLLISYGHIGLNCHSSFFRMPVPCPCASCVHG